MSKLLKSMLLGMTLIAARPVHADLKADAAQVIGAGMVNIGIIVALDNLYNSFIYNIIDPKRVGLLAIKPSKYGSVADSMAYINRVAPVFRDQWIFLAQNTFKKRAIIAGLIAVAGAGIYTWGHKRDQAKQNK